MAKKIPKEKSVTHLKHEADKRKNIPTAEFQSVLKQEEESPIRIAYERRNRDLNPQLVWRGKDEQNFALPTFSHGSARIYGVFTP